MKLTVKTAGKIDAGTRVAFVYEGEDGDRAVASAVKDAKAREPWKGKLSEIHVAYPDGRQRLLLVGLGKRKEFTTERLRRAAAAAALKLKALKAPDAAFVLPDVDGAAHAVTEGATLALYEFDRYKPAKNGEKKVEPTYTLVGGKPDAVDRARAYSEATCLTRDLVNEPAGCCTPRRLAAKAVEIARTSKGLVKTKVLDGKQIQKARMGGLHGVSLGSVEPPRFAHLAYKPKLAKKRIVVVGKGITFDSGGLCLKPADGMLRMKYDMAGAAVVLGVMSALPRLRPNVEVHGILGATENMPGPGAYKMGDVLTARNGKTVEITNTDAEGRLVLMDCLSYGSELKPDEMIDVATLTGAIMIGLGAGIAGLFANDDGLADDLLACAKAEGEKLWRMPMDEDYKKMIESPLAELVNAAGRPGGAINAALFLRDFVARGIKWAHLDIAGPAYVEKPEHYQPIGATGCTVRTILRHIENA